MNKTRTMGGLALAMFAILMLSASAEASITHKTSADSDFCSGEVNDVCVVFSGWDYWHAMSSNSWATERVVEHMKMVYSTPQSYISTVHDNGVWGSAKDMTWMELISSEVSLHRMSGDGYMHFSKYYISLACQKYGGSSCRRGI